MIDSFLRNQSLVQQQIETYNNFVECSLQTVINELRSIENDTHTLSFNKVYLSKQTFAESDGAIHDIYPFDARVRNLTYSSSIFVDVELLHMTSGIIEKFSCYFGKVPVMVGSSICNTQTIPIDNLRECDYDCGGYFIVNGSEKVLIPQEKMNNNHVYVFSKNTTKYQMSSEIRSLVEGDTKSTSTVTMNITVKNSELEQFVRINIPFLKVEICLFIIFHLFGCTNFKKYIKKFNDNDFQYVLFSSVKEYEYVTERHDIFEYINKRLINPFKEDIQQNIQKYFETNLFPHIGNDTDKKLVLLGYMTEQLVLTFLKKREEDDRDHFKNKRIDTSGFLMTSLFRQLVKKMYKDLKMSFCKSNEKIINLTNMIKTKYITNGFKYSLATGNWGSSNNTHNMRIGVSQMLNRHSYISMLSHLRRINSPIGKDGKMTTPRHLHGSHMFRICPSETPEGQACGLVKNLAVCARVSVGYNSNIIRPFLQSRLLQHGKIRLLINGFLLGFTDDEHALVDELKEMRRRCDVHPDTSIVLDDFKEEIRINTDSGRILRPVYVIYDGKIRTYESKEWDVLLKDGVVEYLDCDEEEQCLIAMRPSDLHKKKYTHCELDPSAMLGVCAALIPFPDHNQSPRNCYQSAMGKQAISIGTSNQHERIDTLSHTLLYPQKPIVRTQYSDTLNYDKLPSGQNVIVAVLCYTGYNQEDSIIMNKSSIDRGLFRSFFYRTYKEELKQNSTSSKENFEIPKYKETVSMKNVQYDHLEEDGTAPVGEYLDAGRVIIGKTIDLNKPSALGHTKKDCSTVVRHNESGYVDKVMITSNENGMTLMKGIVRSMRTPEIGDKFSSRHAQKGTIGMVYNQEDMPYTEDGIVPDIIINPHALPSRMTIAQLIECIMGKVCCLSGTYGDATPFTDMNPKDIIQELEKLGYEKNGAESMSNGMTGIKMEGKVFIGPTYYQRLKHMVNDKIHSRSRGPVQMLTRQPVEGRSRDGGLRFGEMERDCIISHGASAFLKERLFDHSDAYSIPICVKCGITGVYSYKDNYGYCKICNNHADIKMMQVPYACKLLFQELMSMSVHCKIL